MKAFYIIATIACVAYTAYFSAMFGEYLGAGFFQPSAWLYALVVASAGYAASMFCMYKWSK